MDVTSHTSIVIHDATGRKFTFSNLPDFREFVGQEANFWREQGKRVGATGKTGRHAYFECAVELEGIAGAIDSLRGELSRLNEAQLEQRIQSVQQQFEYKLKRLWLWSDHPYIRPFVEYHIEHGKEVAAAFINYAVKSGVSLETVPKFLGTMLAYECLHPDPIRENRRDGERRSLEGLRDLLQAETERLQQWGTDTRGEANKWLKAAQSKAEQLQSENKKKGEKQIVDQGMKFDRQMKSWKQEKEDLDSLYAEVLRWREPAKHWKNAAAEHKCQGLIAISVLFLMIVAGLGLLGFLIYGWLQGQKIGVDLDTLHGVVFFGSIMAVYGFFIRVLSRLAFSSFHLMRDAKEREQLTYLYLSLSETDSSEKESRDIVLRALFSRSQTGLLANESGPSIPAEVVQTKGH